jgi:hypothetical protein
MNVVTLALPCLDVADALQTITGISTAAVGLPVVTAPLATKNGPGGPMTVIGSARASDLIVMLADAAPEACTTGLACSIGC